MLLFQIHRYLKLLITLNIAFSVFKSCIFLYVKKKNGGQKQIAPAQRISDFVRGKISGSLPDSSYIPGLISSPMHFWMPESISKRLQEGLKAFDRQMHGFASSAGILVGVESRSSSPIRIPRD